MKSGLSSSLVERLTSLASILYDTGRVALLNTSWHGVWVAVLTWLSRIGPTLDAPPLLTLSTLSRTLTNTS